MNKTRKRKPTIFLKLLLCFALALVSFPQYEAKAADKIVLTSDHIGGSLHGINHVDFAGEIVIDPNNMSATATFSYGEAELIPDAFVSRYQAIAEKFVNNKSATVTYRIVPNDGSGDYDYHLESTGGADGFVFKIEQYSLYKKEFEEHNYKWYPRLAYANYDTVTVRKKSSSDDGNDDPEIGEDEDKDNIYELLIYHPDELYVHLDGGVVTINTSDCTGLAVSVNSEKPDQRQYEMKRDNFSFRNNKNNFYSRDPSIAPKIFGTKSYANGTYGSMLDGSAVVNMLSGRKQSQMAELLAKLSAKWGGSCLGMSTTSGLIFKEKIGLNQVDSENAQDAFHLKEPVSNAPLLRTLTYYQILGNYDYLNMLASTRAANDGMDVSKANDVVKLLKEDPYSPVVVCFDFYRDGSDVRKSHAVLAFKLEETSDAQKYKISVYDPNEPDNTQYLKIAEEGVQDLPNTLTGYGSIFIRACDRSQDRFDKSLTYPVPAKKQVFVQTDGNVKVTNNGQSSETSAVQQEGDDNTFIIASVDASKPVDISLVGGSYASIQTGDEFALISGGAKEATVNPDGSVTAKISGSEGTLAVASDKTNTPSGLFGTTVKTGAGTVTVTPTSKGSNVKTNTGTSDVTVSGTGDSATFGDLDTSKGVDINTNGRQITVSSEGTPIAKGEANENGGKTEKINDEPKPGPEPEDDPEKDPETGGHKSSYSPIPVIENGTLYMVKGQSFTFTNVQKGWTSDNIKTVSVTGAGKVSAIAPGTTTIKNKDAGKQYTVTVVQPQISKKSLSLLCGEDEDLTIVLKTLNGEDVSSHYAVSWSSSAPSIARVDGRSGSCKVSALSSGTATITSHVNGKSYSIKAKVLEKDNQKLTGETCELTLMPLQTVTLKLSGKSFKNCTWEGLNTETNGKKTDYYNDIVYITSTGKLTAIGPGKTELHCSNGVVINVTVKQPTERVKYINVGKKLTLKYDGVKSTKNNKPEWTCDDTTGIINKSELERNGTIKAEKTGEVLVGCKYRPYGNKSEGFTFKTRVYVENPALVTDSSKLIRGKDQYNYTLNLTAGDSFPIEFSKSDGYGISQPVQFQSSKAATAFVDENGIIRSTDVQKKTTVNITFTVNGKKTTIKVALEPKKERKDNDETGFNPTDWSWDAQGEGYGRKIFTSGKYVRADGRAVVYIDSSDSPDGFSYQLYAKEVGSKENSFTAAGSDGSAYAWAQCKSTGSNKASDTYNGLSFISYENGKLEVASDWIDEMYYAYGDPAGTFYLVREKK